MPNLFAPSRAHHSVDVASGWRARRLLAGLLLLSVLVAFFTKGTYDSGDSLLHYEYAHYAFKHPLNLLNSWAKPLFTLLAAVPAQFGFLGMKLFQCAVVALSAWCAFIVARALRLPAPELAILFAYAAPDYFLIQFSGLTEPLFGLLLVGAAALAVRGQPAASAVVLSWLPFVRSEGFILLGIWVVYFCLKREWRCLPLLLLGYAVYSAVGAVVLGELDWVFGRNPYDTVSVYGHGNWSHFVRNIPNLLGWILTILFVLGGLRMVRDSFRPARWQTPLFLAELLLVYGSIAVFVGAHTIFWAEGLFNSAGLQRVLAITTPLAAVVALNGLALLLELGRSEAARRRIRVGATVAVVAWPFTGARNAIRPERDFGIEPDQELARRAGNWFRQAHAGRPLPPVAFQVPSLASALRVDPFDEHARPLLTRDGRSQLATLPLHTLLFWDEWAARYEARLPLAQLRRDPRFRLRWQDALPRDYRHPEHDSCQIVVFERVK